MKRLLLFKHINIVFKISEHNKYDFICLNLETACLRHNREQHVHM